AARLRYRADRSAHVPASRGNGWCRRCCGCRRRRRRNGRSRRASPPAPPDAGPCRDSRWSTTRHLAAAPPVVVHRPREIPGSAFEVGKDAIASLAPQLTKLLLEKGFVIHHAPLPAADRDPGREDAQAADYD